MGSKSEKQEEKGSPIMVIKDKRTKRILARMIPQKGVSKYAIKKLKIDIDQMGYKKIILKSDNEPAIMALKQAVKDMSTVEIINEESPVGDSKANGDIENAIQRMEGQFRTLKLALDASYNTRIEGNHAIIPWIIMHSCCLLSWYQVGSDGKTPFQRWKGRNFRRPIAKVGECIFWLKEKSVGINKMLQERKQTGRWEEGHLSRY